MLLLKFIKALKGTFFALPGEDKILLFLFCCRDNRAYRSFLGIAIYCNKCKISQTEGFDFRFSPLAVRLPPP